MKTIKAFLLFPTYLAITLLTGCTTVVIDEYRQGEITLNSGDQIIVLGRRHVSDHETEPDLVACIGDSLSSKKDGITVIPEQSFVDELYPWFEPRTAPTTLRRLDKLLKDENIAQKFTEHSISHIIWVDGNTETTSSSGSIGCSISPGGAGCFGFGTWEKESDYEVSIWDLHERTLLGKISADASGTSYMPAVIIPIPFIARVQNNACKAIGKQLRSFFIPDTAS